MKKILLALLIAAILTTAILLAACEPDPEPEPDDPGHIHTFSDEIVDPTCTDGGYTKHTCTECGYVMRDEFTDASDKYHSFDVEEFEATCTEDAYTTKTCKYCGYIEVAVDKGSAGHVWDEWDTVTNPTCTDWGLEKRYCLNCDECEENSIAPSHSYEIDSILEPTCTSGGYTTYKCTECGDTYTDDITKALGHKLSDWEVTREHTCTDHGEMERHCTRDDCTYNETKDESSELHRFELVETVEPTENTHGYEIWKCPDCEKTVIRNITHYYTDWQPCSDDPNKECRECTICGSEEHRTAA